METASTPPGPDNNSDSLNSMPIIHKGVIFDTGPILEIYFQKYPEKRQSLLNDFLECLKKYQPKNNGRK